MGLLGLHGCPGFSLDVVSGGYSAVCGLLLIVVASLVAEHMLQAPGLQQLQYLGLEVAAPTLGSGARVQ